MESTTTPALESPPFKGTTNITTFSLEELQNFTCNFTQRNCLKRDGSRTMFKGLIWNLADKGLNGKRIVVKCPQNGSHQFRLKWEAEMRYLSYVSHRNILPLLGQCQEDWKFYLVYPFMHRGNVKKNLPGLKWERTLDILIGASLALVEVHRHNLVFRDFKSENILLDEDWTPVLSGFGSVTPEGEVFIDGTSGYTDPEIFLSRIPGTKQTDIFSLGIFILQLITRRKELGIPLREKVIEDVRLKMHAMDDTLRVLGGCPVEVARDITNLALKCVDSNFQVRPTAMEVHQDLLEYKAMQTK